MEGKKRHNKNACPLSGDDHVAGSSKMEIPPMFVRPATSCRWYRAQVREVLNEGQEAVVFFADYGDTGRFPTNQLLAVLPWMMLLPYQAVPCSLAGVRPEAEDGWAPTAGSTLEDFGYDGADNSRPLCLRVARRRRDGQGGGSSYEVLLFDSCEAGRASAADWLIQKGMAVATELPPLDFDWTVPHAPCQAVLVEGTRLARGTFLVPRHCSLHQHWILVVLERPEARGPLEGADCGLGRSAVTQEEEAASEGQTDSEDAKELACRMEMEEQMSRMFGEYNRFVLSRVCGLPKEVSGAAERVGATPSSPPRSTEVDPEKGCASEGSSEAHESQQVAPGDQVPTLDPVSDTGGRVRARGGREHVVCERLFARVKPKKTELVEKPGGIKLTLEKECPSLTWEFLTLQRKKVPRFRSHFNSRE
ncbi:hypothetical protein HPB48_023197 [Haemaphysalis longicornis]|uniref:Tudor domain-containing protein n=1 Tax=Haemaphysalis longicornis TaxID=44386 RepID=A0A9J6H7D7_HAELO|nr:hypothetical protein HPB48_023197 [Haemaphysalis longicornis]